MFQYVYKEHSDLLGVLISMKVVWKYVTTVSGARCVMIDGATMMLVWCAGRLDFHDTVSQLFKHLS